MRFRVWDVMSLHYEAPESNPCTHTHPLTLEQPQKSQWEKWWEKAQWKEWHLCWTNGRKWHTGLFLHSHLEGTQRCGEPLHTQQYVIWALNETIRQSRTCWLRSMFSLSKPQSRVSLGFWIEKVIVPHRFDFRHIASIYCKKKQPTTASYTSAVYKTTTINNNQENTQVIFHL